MRQQKYTFTLITFYKRLYSNESEGNGSEEEVATLFPSVPIPSSSLDIERQLRYLRE